MLNTRLEDLDRTGQTREVVLRYELAPGMIWSLALLLPANWQGAVRAAIGVDDLVVYAWRKNEKLVMDPSLYDRIRAILELVEPTQPGILRAQHEVIKWLQSIRAHEDVHFRYPDEPHTSSAFDQAKVDHASFVKAKEEILRILETTVWRDLQAAARSISSASIASLRGDGDQISDAWRADADLQHADASLEVAQILDPDVTRWNHDVARQVHKEMSAKQSVAPPVDRIEDLLSGLASWRALAGRFAEWGALAQARWWLHHTSTVALERFEALLAGPESSDNWKGALRFHAEHLRADHELTVLGHVDSVVWRRGADPGGVTAKGCLRGRPDSSRSTAAPGAAPGAPAAAAFSTNPAPGSGERTPHLTSTGRRYIDPNERSPAVR